MHVMLYGNVMMTLVKQHLIIAHSETPNRCLHGMAGLCKQVEFLHRCSCIIQAIQDEW